MPPSHALSTLPVARGGGRGLKAVQNSREQTSTASGADGSVTHSKKSVKEQRVFHAHNNAHVETKVMSEQKRKTTRKDGTVVITESKSLRKVCYMSPRRGKPASESLAKEDDLTPRQVLRQIAGLQKEMSEMESSLECLRHEMEAEPEPEEAARPHRSRLRQRLPESLAWLEEVAREPRRCRVVFPASRTAKAQSVR
eukprot:g24269.t2